MHPKLALTAVCCMLFSICLVAQKKKNSTGVERVTCKFGNVQPADFAPAVYEIDSTAEAVYLFDGGESKFVGNRKSSFNIDFSVHERIRLLNKNAFSDLGKVTIYLHTPSIGDDEDLNVLEAATYNIENGKVVVTKVNKSDIFREKDGEYTTVKFTFPNLHEGSIIEYKYNINSPGVHLQQWSFQGSYPRLWSEYEVLIPEYFNYVFLRQGYLPYAIDTASFTTDNYIIANNGGTGASNSFSVTAKVSDLLWAMKDVPTLKKESYTTTLRNHLAKIEFQLQSINYPNAPVEMVMHSWPKVAETLMQDEDFGANIKKANNYFDDDIKKVLAGETVPLQKAKKIFEYVRDNFFCTDTEAFYLSQPLKKTYSTKKGSVADINILLTTMYNSIGLESNPAILSTSDHGKPLETYPILSKYNYVICGLNLDGKYYMLDASQNKVGFGHLPSACYNGTVRLIIPEAPVLVDLSPDSLTEQKSTFVVIMNDSANQLSGSVSSTKGYDESLSLRSELSKKSEADFFAKIQKSYTDEIVMQNANIENLKELDQQLKVNYDLRFKNEEEDLIYFNPMLAEQQKDNPFTAAERYYPVEMPYCWNESYILNMEIPKGYTIDELPKSARVNLNENEGSFEYLISSSAERIQMRCNLKLNKAVYEPEDYQTLRDFFAFVVKKESEQIVFKKIK